jgi:hypothetical protein
MKPELSPQIFEKYSNIKFRKKKIRPVGAELFLADGRTDTTKIRVAFRNLSKSA